MNIKGHIAGRIKQCLKEAGLSQAEAARRLGHADIVVHRWVKGERTPRGYDVFRIAHLCGKPMEWFYREEGAVSLPLDLTGVDGEVQNELLCLLDIARRASPDLRHLLIVTGQAGLARKLGPLEFGRSGNNVEREADRGHRNQ